MEKRHCTAIVLAAGQGKRMGTKVHKQYLLIAGKPILYYSLYTFQQSEILDEIVLVTGPGEEDYCREKVVEPFAFTKVSKILAGGAERYHSVWNALQEIDGEGYVFIHDGARPFLDEGILERAYQGVLQHNACVVGMPVKDTIKLSDEKEYVADTPERSRLWMVQTPQVFSADLVKKAYSMLMDGHAVHVTDDAMVVETMLGHPVKLVRGSYENIKITTPEDLEIGEMFAKRKYQNSN